MNAWLFGGIIFVLVWGVLLYAFHRAPLGYEDENGFHYEEHADEPSALLDFQPKHKHAGNGVGANVAERCNEPDLTNAPLHSVARGGVTVSTAHLPLEKILRRMK